MIFSFFFFLKRRVIFFCYLFLVFIASLGLPWWAKGIFWIFSTFLIFILPLNQAQSSQGKERTFFRKPYLVLFFMFLFFIFIRAFPFFHGGEAPLGYDTGMYRRHWSTFFEVAIQTGDLNDGYPVSFFTNILQVIGWTPDMLISVFYVFLGVFVGIALYAVAKEYFHRDIAIFSVVLYVLSVSQFVAYWGMYWRMWLAMGLSLASIYLLKKKSWSVIPVAGFMGGVHLLSFLPFALALIAFFIFGKERRFTFFAGVGIFFVTVLLSYNTILGVLPYYTNHYGFIQDYPSYIARELTGIYLSFSLYKGYVLLYLPFAIIGLMRWIFLRDWNYLFFYFLVNFVIMSLELVFYQRFIILMDLVGLILAAWVMYDFCLYFWNGEDRFIGKVIIFLFFFGAFVNITYHSWKLKPLIDGEEIEAIRSLQSIKGDFLAMSISSYYAPWIYGYSGMGTIAPGLFEYNKWDLEKWNRFWFTENPSVRRELLNEYDRTIYIFVGKKDPDIDFSHDNAFTQIHPHIWKFIPKKTL